MSPKVLIIEDQISLAQAIAKLLARYKIEATVSGDGIEGLKAYTTRPYDLLIVDLHLPKLSGVEVIRKVRSTAHGKDLPIIIMTGVYKSQDYADKAKELFGIRHYLIKPFSQEAFLQAIKESLRPEAGPGPEKKSPGGPEPVRPSTTERPPARLKSKETVGPEPPRTQAGANGHRPVAEIKPRQALMGNLKDAPMDRLLMDFKANRSTGTLFVKREEEERTILFVEGSPIGLATTKSECSYGNHLFCKGKISLMEYQVYQGRRKNGTDSDELFIKMGALAPEEHGALWRQYLQESLISMFGWERAEFTFQLWPCLEGAPCPSVINLAHVIHQGFIRHSTPQRTASLREKAGDRFLGLTPSFYDYQMHIQINPEESLFLDMMDGSRRLEELLPEDPEKAEKMLRSFGAFSALGMVSFHAAPELKELEAPFPVRERPTVEVKVTVEEKEYEAEEAPEGSAEVEEETEEEAVALGGEVGFDDLLGDLEDDLGDVVESMQPAPQADAARGAEEEQGKKDEELIDFLKTLGDKDYYEIFGMSQGNFDFSKLKDEYFRLTKKFSPERFITSSGDVLEKAENVLSRLATGYNTLSNVVSKEKYDEMLAQKIRVSGGPGSRDKDHDKMQAEVAFQSGMAFIAMSDWDGAEKSMAEAMSLAPDNPDIIAQYAYTIYNRNKKSKAIQNRARELLAQALKIKPKCAPAFAYRGAMLFEEEKVALAEADFKKALSINPRYKFALKGLKKIEAARQDEKKGFFGRFMK